MLQLPLLVLVAAALAQEEPQPSNLSRTSVGASTVVVPAIGAADLDLLLGQTLRWTVKQRPDGFDRVWFDGRITLDPVTDVLLERTQVTRAGVELGRGAVTVDLGRAPVRYGGPRLVDGAQGVVAVGDVEVGAWLGLAPDLFTTVPRLRPALGPIVAWHRSAAQASLVGELAFDDAFALDRAASLAMVRVTADRRADLSGRLDVDWVSEAGGPHLADGQVLAVLRPGDTWRIDALYDAFSSLRYLQTEPLDPLVLRFQERLLALGLDLGVTQDFLDPSLNHLVAGGVRWTDRAGLGARPRVGVDGRWRWHPNPINRFARIHGEIGVGEIPAAGVLDVALDGGVSEVDSNLQEDVGLTVAWEPGDAGTLALDGSFRVLLAPSVYDGVGWYTDLFVDALLSDTWTIAAGAMADRAPDPDYDDLGIGALARVTLRVR